MCLLEVLGKVLATYRIPVNKHSREDRNYQKRDCGINYYFVGTHGFYSKISDSTGNCFAIFALERSLKEFMYSARRFISSGGGLFDERIKLMGTRETLAI